MKENECGLLITRISISMGRTLNHYLDDVGITLSQWRCIEYLYDHSGEEIYLRDLEQYFNISQPAVTGIVKRLREKQLVCLTHSQTNPHYKTISLTEQGIAVHDTCLGRKINLEEFLLGSLTTNEREELLRLLKKIDSHMSSYYGKENQDYNNIDKTET